MKTHYAWISGSLAAVSSLQASNAHAQVYAEQLLRPSTLTLETCLPPCACPSRGFEGPLHGTFQLSLLGIGSVFDFYEITDVRFSSDLGLRDVRLIGGGVYRYSEIADLHQMTLDLREVGANATIHLESDIVALTSRLPRIRIELQTSIESCLRWSMSINAAPCIADVDDGTGTGTTDGGVTIEDLLFYLHLFDRGSIRADVDDGTFSGTQDGGVTIDDLLYFLYRFAEGC